MWTAKWILDAYEEGDETVRWELYMTYRDLRSCFEGIEARQENRSEQKVDEAADTPEKTWFSHLVRLAKG